MYEIFMYDALKLIELSTKRPIALNGKAICEHIWSKYYEVSLKPDCISSFLLDSAS